MKGIIYFLIVLIAFFACGSQKQELTKKEVLEVLNDEYNKKIVEDSMITFALKKMAKFTTCNTRPNLDSIRKVLRKYRIFDYNVKFYEIEIASTEKDKSKFLKDEINKIAPDSNFNKVGINFFKNGKGTIVQILETENYMNIKWGYLSMPAPNGFEKNPLPNLILDGVSSQKEIFYEVSDNEKILKKTFSNKLNLRGNYFNLDIPFPEDNYLFFYDAKGEILALFTAL